MGTAEAISVRRDQDGAQVDGTQTSELVGRSTGIQVQVGWLMWWEHISSLLLTGSYISLFLSFVPYFDKT